MKMVPAPTQPASPSPGWVRSIASFTWPISTFGIFTWLHLSSDRWALHTFAGKQDVGLYAVLYQLGYYPMSLATDMLTQFLAPIFFQRAGDATDPERNTGVRRTCWRLTAVSLLTTGATVLVAAVLHRPIFRLLVDSQYASASRYLPWMLLAGGIFAMGQALALILLSEIRTRAMSVAKIVTACLGIVLNVLGAYRWGLAGIVAANLVFSVIFCAWIAVLSASVSRREGCDSCLPPYLH
jgi:O-antigen/teichoic acid export membrane protein